MQTEWFIVVEAQGAWWIDNEGKSFGPFSSREQAGTEAIVIARTFGERKRRTQVYAPDERGKQHLVWEGA